MCDFHSVVINRNGDLHHIAINSHSEAVVDAGWRENMSLSRPTFWEFEWDCRGPMPARFWRGDPPPDIIEIAQRHYAQVAKAIRTGELTHRLRQPNYSDVRIKVAKQTVNPDLLAELAEDIDKDVRATVASSTFLYYETFHKLAKDSSSTVTTALAHNQQTPADVLAILSDSLDALTRYAVALNPATSVEILVKLSTDDAEAIRGNIAGHFRTPVDVLTKLASDAGDHVRYWVARNSNTPPEILEKLANDPIWAVRCNAAYNPNVPQAALERLMKSACKRIALIAESMLQARQSV